MKQKSAIFDLKMCKCHQVTCIKWAPGRADMFVASHASGHLYTYLADTECPTLPPQYTVIYPMDRQTG